ncbi:MAG: hypothetical protein Q9226_005189 [Calogaya cf. arnoldii]
MAATDAFNNHVVNKERGPMVLDAIRNKRCFVSMPSFHIAGIDYMLPKAFYQGIVPVLSPPGAPVTAELVDAMHQLDLVEISVVAPSILQDIASSPSLLENLRRLSATIYGGGPLPPSAGDAIISRTQLYNLMGSSETANVPTEMVDPEDWEYLKFSPMLGYQMRHHSGDLFELCFIRQTHLDLFQSVFSTFPDRQHYFTSDLYVKHTTKHDLWKYQGRADDILTLTNGEKVNPVGMEHVIEAHRDVKSALVVGQARFQTALLIEANEPPSSTAAKAGFIENLWPTVEKANIHCDSHAKVARDLILFTTAEKPFLRAGKGTVQRRMTVDAYHDEIDIMYGKLDKLVTVGELESSNSTSFGGPQVPPEATTACAISHVGWLQQLICGVTGWPSLDPDRDFFEMGMDSLQVINLVRRINAAASPAANKMVPITASTIYSNPSVTKLAKVLTNSPQSSESRQLDPQPDNISSNRQVNELLAKYSWNLPVTSRSSKSWRLGHGMKVLLTGSTGSLGSYILGRLLANCRVSHIYCLNRSANSEKRQRDSHISRGLQTDWHDSRVSFLQGDLSKEYLGLSIDTYRSSLDDVTHIMHNAWEVNFNLPLASFEIPHLLGVRQFIDFSARSAYGASILFISSVSSAMGWPVNHTGSVPEHIIDDPSAALPMGYAQSKYIAEHLLNTASQIAGISTTVIRVGQVAGPVETNQSGGCWNKQEWLPSLVASSRKLGKLPDSLGPNDVIDWIPVDVLSGVLVELMEASVSVTAPSDVQVHEDGPAANGYQVCKREKDWLPVRQCEDNFSHVPDGSHVTTKGINGWNVGQHVRPDCPVNRYDPTTNGHPQDPTSPICDNVSAPSMEDDHNEFQDFNHKTNLTTVYNAINPNHTTWSTLLPTIQCHFADTPLEIVSLPKWINVLKESANGTQDPNLNPAIRLLDFYENLAKGPSHAHPVLDTTKTVNTSRRLGALEAVKPEWMKLWLEQWDF